VSSVSSNKLISIVGESSNNTASILVNELAVVLNQENGSVAITETVNSVNAESNETNLNINTVGDTIVLSVSDEVLEWINYATGFSADPTLTQTIETGDVYTYTYSNGTLYRLVPSGSEQDAFYRVFSSGVLSNLVVTKGIEI
jgi:hypothetical protein